MSVERKVLAILALVAGLAAALAHLLPRSSFEPGEFPTSVEVAAGALAMLGGVAAAVRSRVDGYAPAWWIGFTLCAAGLPALAAGTESGVATGVRFGAAVVAFGCALRASFSPEVDTHISPSRSLLVAVGAGLVLVPVMGTLVTTTVEAVADTTTACAFGVLALVATNRARRRSGAAPPVLTPLLTGLALAAAVAATVPATNAMHAGAAALVLLATTSFATVRTVGDLHAASALQRDAAFQSHLLRREAEQGRRQVEDRFAEKMHEVRSTVRALEGGVRSLDVGYAGDTEMLGGSALASALVAEVQRLQALATDEQEPSELTRYDVRTVLEPMLTVSAAGGWPVSWSIPAGLEASGRPGDLAQVVHGLLANSTRHAPGTPIDVTARRDAEFVLVTVEDRGPGVDRRAREVIFQRGAHTPRPENESQGLGLYIARSLVRRKGGDIWVEPRARGGARFVVAVPTADPAARQLGDAFGVVRPFVRPAGSRRSGAFGRRVASTR